MVYKTFDSLNGKTLQIGDIVIIKGREFIIRPEGYINVSYSNTNSVWANSNGREGWLKTKLGITQEILGYLAIQCCTWKNAIPNVDAPFPNFYEWEVEGNEYDFEGLSLLMLCLLSLAEGYTPAILRPEGWTVPVLDAPPKFPLNDEYDALIYPQGIVAGCQFIPMKNAIRLAKMLVYMEEKSLIKKMLNSKVARR